MKKTFRKVIALFIMLSLLSGCFSVAVSAAVYTGACGDAATWSFNDESGTLVISGNGAMTDWSSERKVPWYSYRNSVSSVIIENGITSIGSFAFYFCNALKQLSLPDTLTRIGISAFYNCSLLESFTLPDSLEHIGGYAFSNTGYYSNSVNWEDGIIYIGKYLLEASESISEEVAVKNGTTVIADSAFFDNEVLSSVTFPETLRSIGNSSFYGCDKLSRVSFPDSVVEISEYAFEDCTSLVSVTFGSGLEEISPYAFAGCSSLESLTIPDTLRKIGDYAFENCISLADVLIGEGTESIGEDIFYGCTALEGISVSEDNPNYSTDETGVLFNKNKTELIYYPRGNTRTEYTVPETVTVIGAYSFFGCSALSVINLPNYLKTVGNDAFKNCKGLTAANYYGSSAQWSSVDIGTNNTYLTDVLVFEYNSDKPYLAEGTCGDGLTWKYYDDGDLVIDGTGYMTEWVYTADVPWYEYREDVKSVMIGRGVKSIAVEAFFRFDSLTSIFVYPENENYHSDECGVLFNKDKTELIQYPVANTRTSYTVPDSVTSFGIYAFRGCKKLQEFSMPVSAYIPNDSYTFSGCSNMAKITLTKGNGVMQNFGNTSSSSSLTTYYAYTPWYISKSNLKELTIEEGATNIGDYAFNNNTGLSEIVIPDTVKTIGKYAFSKCSQLSKLVISDSAESIDNFAFNGLTSLKELTMPVSVKIYNSANTFSNCTKIEKITFTKGTGVMQSYGTSTSSSSIYPYYAYTPWYISQNLKEIVFEEGIKKIGSYAFYYCKVVNSVSFPESLEEIEKYAFYSCSKLPLVELKSSIKKIGDYAFGNCTSLHANYVGRHSDWRDVVVGIGNKDLTDNLTFGAYPDRPYYAIGECGNDIEWIVYADGELDIIGTGSMFGWLSSTSVPWSNQANTITKITISDSVTNIGTNAFSACTAVESISLGKDISEIGQDAFASSAAITDFNYCGDLESWCKIVFGNATSNPCSLADNILFDGQPLPENIVIPQSITAVNSYAFKGFDNIISVTLHSGISQIGEYAFSDCTSLAEIVIPQNTEFIEEGAFSGCVALTRADLSSKVKVISPYAFDGCTSLTEVILPVNANHISSYAFRNCTSLKEIVIPDTVTVIGNSAFYNCSALREVTLGESLSTLTYNAFYGCNLIDCTNYNGTYTQWKTIKTESGNQSVTSKVLFDADSDDPYYLPGECGEDAIWTMHSNGELRISGTGEMDDYRTSTSAPWYTYQAMITSVVIEDGITNIGDFAFYSYSNIEKLTLGDTVKTVGDSAFVFCFKLREISFGESLEVIGDSAFAYTSALGTVSLPQGIKEIGDFAFNYSGITDIHIPNTVEYIGDLAFNECNSLESVSYQGTYEQWLAVETGVRNEALTQADISFGTESGELPEETGLITVSENIGYPGQTIEVNVRIDKNPGIVALMLNVRYDRDVLTLVGVTDKGLLGTDIFNSGNNLSAVPYRVFWVDPLATEDRTETGDILTLTFKVSDEATDCNTQISIEYVEASTFDKDMQGARFTVTGGNFKIRERISGDANGDGTIDLKDVVAMRRSLAGGFDVEVNNSNSDVDGNGVFNLVDVALLTRYLAGGWDVELK